MLHLILGFTFGVLASRFDFHKINVIQYYLKKEINLKDYIERIMGLIMVYAV